MKLEPDRQIKVLEFLSRQLAEAVKCVRTSMEHIQSQRYILTINDVMNSDMEKILADLRFEFYALDLDLERGDKPEQFWSHMDAIANDLVNYISAWRDIMFYNDVKFKPYKFWDAPQELYKAMYSQEGIKNA